MIVNTGSSIYIGTPRIKNPNTQIVLTITRNSLVYNINITIIHNFQHIFITIIQRGLPHSSPWPPILVVTLRGRPGDGEFCSTLPVVLKCLTMFQTLVLGSRSLFAIAPVDSPCLCNVMIFWRNTKHFVIFEGTKILTWFSADRHSWVWPISCPSQKCGKIQITSYRTRNVAFQYIWRTL